MPAGANFELFSFNCTKVKCLGHCSGKETSIWIICMSAEAHILSVSVSDLSDLSAATLKRHRQSFFPFFRHTTTASSFECSEDWTTHLWKTAYKQNFRNFRNETPSKYTWGIKNIFLSKTWINIQDEWKRVFGSRWKAFYNKYIVPVTNDISLLKYLLQTSWNRIFGTGSLRV